MNGELETLTRRIQEALGFTGADLDGRYGVKTAHAILGRFPDRQAGSPPAESGGPPNLPAAAIDARSARNIASLSTWVRPVATSFLQKLQTSGINAQIISGIRSYAEQDELYAKGRTTEGTVVTNARGGHSNHNFGIAFDIGIFDSRGKYLEESLLYDKAGSLGKGMGLSWGGDWDSFPDKPHFELRPGWAEHLPETAMISELRRRTAAGESIA